MGKCCKCAGEEKKTLRENDEKKRLLDRLSRIEGQIRGVRRMIENDAYCTDVLTQSAAVTAALNSFSRQVLASHMKGCMVRDIREGNDQVIDELLDIMQKLTR